MPAMEWQQDIEEKLNSTSTVVVKLFRLIQKYNNDSPLTIVNPKFLLLTNDTVQFIFEGRRIGKDQFRFVSNKCLKVIGIHLK